ncbi:4-phosphoerythronate dehydrogenase PdxB [Simiduia litorea]|uniref:4-phosphoerythronate dehydrogenase n=1 Tax=Simiduia litorea TaxID=1435348 RepID=UPI0036F38E4C
MKPLILVDENIPEAELYFENFGRVERFAGRNLTAADLGDAKALIVRSVTKVNATLLSASQVEFVGTCTIGTDHIDKHWLTSQRIGFSSAPGCNANSVVEYVIAALAYAEVDWQNLSFGVVGCGNVGGSVYRALSNLGAEVVGYDPLIDQNKFPIMGSLSDVLSCDVICIHAPLTRDGEFPTQYMIAADELMQLKPGALLVSAGRGAVVNNEDLLTVKKQRSDLRLILDVWAHEPWVCKELLAQAAIGTPHIAGYSWDGKVMGTRMISTALAQFWGAAISSEPASNVVTPSCSRPLPLSSEAWQQVRKIILQSYDIASDDQRLRNLVNNASSREDVERGFDQLRRNYPERREFRFTSPVDKPSDLAARQCLETLGFPFL